MTALTPGVGGGPVAWQPHALAPVFFSWRDYGPADGAPDEVRVFFPSADVPGPDGVGGDGALLEHYWRYPLILLAHGRRALDEQHHQRWFGLPAQLARAGYVVAVPALAPPGAGPSAPEPDLDAAGLAAVAGWLRTSWVHRRVLAGPAETGVVGHSTGALLAGRLAATARHRAGWARARRSAPSVRAFASLSGTWLAWPDSEAVLGGIDAAKLFVRGTKTAEEADADILGFWNGMTGTRYDVQVDAMAHWDYVDDDAEVRIGEFWGSDPPEAPPHYAVVADIVTMFFAKHLPAPRTRALTRLVPTSLVPRPLRLTREQRFFARGFMAGVTRLTGREAQVVVSYETPGARGTVSVP